MLEYKNIYVERPLADRNEYLTPHVCRLGSLTYSGNIYVDFIFQFEGVIEECRRVNIGKMPIMLGSSLCNLNKGF